MPRKSPDSKDERPQKPSRSANKRSSHARQALGLEIARLTAQERATLPLTPELAEAMNLLDKITDREGRRRQEQFIGRLMREADEEALRRALSARQARDAAEAARFHAAENWRARFLEATSAELPDLLAQFRQNLSPNASGPTYEELAHAIDAARAARSRGDASPRAARVLFRCLAAALAS